MIINIMSDLRKQNLVYQPLEEVKSVVSTLVENIYNDSSYQDYLNDLREVDSSLSNKKLDLISKTFTDIKVFNTTQSPLFLANDIGIILGVSSITTMTKNYTPTEKITGMISINNKLVNKNFLTKYGVYRIMFTNKSKLSDVFRAFIYKLLDYMEVNGADTTRELMEEVNAENPELVTEALAEYSTNLDKYKHLYELEIKEKKQLESLVESNYILYKDIVNEKTEMEIEQNFNAMYIQQLEKDKLASKDRIYNLIEDINLDETVLALEYMKKKFFKEYTISLVNPSVVNDIFTSKKYPVDKKERDYIVESYISDFDFLLNTFTISNKINEEQVYFVTLAFKSIEKEKESVKENVKETYIMSDYINDKVKFLEMLELIKLDCSHYHMPGSRKGTGNYVYKISIEQIKLFAKELIITI